MRSHNLALLALGALAAGSLACAQDATIVNARIAVGDGPVIEHGSIVVQNGHIVSVQPGRPAQMVGTVIDATGMTALPGFVDGHKHITSGPLEKQQMGALIESGFTTVLNGGGPPGGDVKLRQDIDSGMINGPHVIPSGRVNLHGTPEEARAAVRQMAAQGIKFTAEMAVTPEPGPTPNELAVLRAVVDEGRKDGVVPVVHAVSTPAMVAATEAGIRHQVHLPNKDFMGFDDAKTIVDSGAMVLDLISFGDPIIDVFAPDNLPRFRTGLLWPESIAGANRDAQGRATGTEGAYTLINARRIWDASGGKGLGFGSDQSYPAGDVLEHELKSLMVMFSMQDVVRILTINTATWLNMQNDIGTLDPRKQADIVLVQGNPYADFRDLLKTVVVLKDGKVVVDKRANRAVPEDLGATGAGPATGYPAVGTLTASVARSDQAPVMGCSGLGTVRLAQGRVMSAQDAAASSLQEAASPARDRRAMTIPVPAHCVVSAQLRPARGANIRLQVWLPDSGWNGSLLVQGSGNAVPERALSGPLAQGYAVATSDTGRPNTHARAQQRTELAVRAAHATAVQAKALLAAYYHGSPRYTYWISGPQRAPAFTELQSNPGDFDGVVVGAAAGSEAAGAASPDLSAFAARGGKLIEYHGGGQVPTGEVAAKAYESVADRSGGLERTRSFYRLFLLPAGQHGDTYRTRWLPVLDQWVQRDRAPGVVLADHNPPPGPIAQPPAGAVVFAPKFGTVTVCAYPNVARVQSGNGEEPQNYMCLPPAAP
jgi:imidazolonepropionase-like amidohydrolase